MQPQEVLGVPLGASADVVRAAYKRAALESHPDKGGSKDCGWHSLEGGYAELGLECETGRGWGARR
eukprot:763689-Amphidinium_carterae.1